jgi:hypothetical protein
VRGRFMRFGSINQKQHPDLNACCQLWQTLVIPA